MKVVIFFKKRLLLNIFILKNSILAMGAYSVTKKGSNGTKTAPLLKSAFMHPSLKNRIKLKAFNARSRLIQKFVPIRFGKNFKAAKCQEEMPLSFLTNMGFPGIRKFQINRVHYRKPWLLPLANWKAVSTTSVANVFELSNGVQVVVKPELDVAPYIGKKGRFRNKYVRQMIPVLEEIVRRKIRMESPLAYLETENGQRFYVVRKEKGITLQSFLSEATSSQQIQVGKNIGEALADLHNKGAVHSHPHLNNWLVYGTNARLIDTKAVFFKEDFPHKFNSGRLMSWKDVVQHDLEVVMENLENFPQMALVVRENYLAKLKPIQ